MLLPLVPLGMQHGVLFKQSRILKQSWLSRTVRKSQESTTVLSAGCNKTPNKAVKEESTYSFITAGGEGTEARV